MKSPNELFVALKSDEKIIWNFFLQQQQHYECSKMYVALLCFLSMLHNWLSLFFYIYFFSEKKKTCEIFFSRVAHFFFLGSRKYSLELFLFLFNRKDSLKKALKSNTINYRMQQN